MSSLVVFLRAAAIGALLSVAVGGGASAADYTLNVNTALTPQDPLYKGLEQFKANVEARTSGKLAVRIFTGSKLGNEEEILEQAQIGAGVATVVDGGRLATFVNEFGILGAPYLAQGYDGIRKVVTSPIFEGWVGKLHDSAHLQVLSFNWWQGERHLLTNKPVTTPADLAGIKMRTPGAPVWMESVRAMGATPTPMAWSDVYAGMQQQVIDGAEAQHTGSYGARLYEVAKYVTKTAHINLITGIVTSAVWFDKLPAEYRQALREEALKAGDGASRATAAMLDDLERQMKEKGQQVNTIDTAPFRNATAVVYEKLGYAALRTELEPILKN